MIVLWIHCVINITVLAVGDVRRTGQVIAVTNHALPNADNATNLTNHLAHCARKTPTVTVVNTPAIWDVYNKTNAKPVIKATALVTLTVNTLSGVISVINNVGRVAVGMHATGPRVNALANVMKHISDKHVIVSAVEIVSLERDDLVT